MATAIIHGDPGSYKTSALISDYLVPAVKAGRVVVTNIRGVKSPEEIAELYGFELPDTSQIILVPFNQDGFEKMAMFFHWVPEGALILMDEGQRVYPTRLRDFKSYDLINPNDERRPRTVEDSFDSHRHMNWDIYISTPNIGKIHKEIRAVAEFGYRHKNMATVFSFMKGRYKRVAHNAENSGSAMGHAISSSIKKIDARCFDVYQSTATGQTKDSQTGFSFFKQPKVVLLLCIIGYSIWNMGSTLYASGGVPSLLGGSAKPASSSPSASATSSPGQAPAGVPPGSMAGRVDNRSDLFGLNLYLVGVVNGRLWIEAVYPDKTRITFDQVALESLGYTFERLAGYVVRVSYDGRSTVLFSKPQPDYVPVVAQSVAAPIAF